MASNLTAAIVQLGEGVGIDAAAGLSLELRMADIAKDEHDVWSRSIVHESLKMLRAGNGGPAGSHQGPAGQTDERRRCAKPSLLTRHGDREALLSRDQMIVVVFLQIDLDPIDLTAERIAARAVIRRHG